MSLAKFVSVDEIEKEALQILPRSVRGYYQSGSDDEQTLARNRKAYRKFVFYQNLIYPYFLDF